MKKILFLLISLFLVILACQKPQHYPKEPQIHFSKIYIVDTLDLMGNIVRKHSIYFKVIDGDADFGLEKKDTLGVFDTNSVYNNNLFMTIYTKKNGIFNIANMQLSLNLRIPKTYIMDLNDYFKAEVKVNFEFPLNIYDTIIKHDTILYSFYVVDKSFNISNIEKSLEIPDSFFGTIIDTTTFIPKQL